EPGLVRLLVRDLDDFGGAAGHRLDPFGELSDRDFFAVADIEDLSDRARFVDQGYHSLHDVADIREAARLRAVPEHGDRLTRERLRHEIRDHHPVLPGLARPARV